MEDKEQDSKQCPFCGETIKFQARKCKHCGEWLDKNNFEQEVKTVACKYCGEEILSTDTVCKHCGEKVQNKWAIKFNLSDIANKFLSHVVVFISIISIVLICILYYCSNSYAEKNINKTLEKIQDTDFHSYSNWSDAEVSYSLQYKDGMLKICSTFNNLEDRALLAITKTFRNYNDEMPVFYVYLYDNDDYELGAYIITLGDLKDGKQLYYNEEDTTENLYVEKTINVNKNIMKKVAKIDTKCMDVIYVTSENFWSYVVAHQR